MKYNVKKILFFMMSFMFCFLVFGYAQEQSRDDVIEKELNCVSQTFDTGQGVSWSDICYTWEEPPESKRVRLINDTLDSFERSGIKASKPFVSADYPRTSVSLEERARKRTVTPKYSDDDIEGWLKNEYPYFYQEYKKKGERPRRYYGDEEPDGKSLIWSFMKNIDYGVIFQSDRKPIYYFETVFPIYQSDKKRAYYF